MESQFYASKPETDDISIYGKLEVKDHPSSSKVMHNFWQTHVNNSRRPFMFSLYLKFNCWKISLPTD